MLYVISGEISEIDSPRSPDKTYRILQSLHKGRHLAAKKHDPSARERRKMCSYIYHLLKMNSQSYICNFSHADMQSVQIPREQAFSTMSKVVWLTSQI